MAERHELPGHYIETAFDEIIAEEEFLGEDFPEAAGVPGYDPEEDGCEYYDENADMCMDWLYIDDDDDLDDE